MNTKDEMYHQGLTLLKAFCRLNKLVEPLVDKLGPKDRLYRLATCAFYRPPALIRIMVSKCANVGVAGQQWSFPGWKTDRTPYGVLQHELGHHVDYLLSQHYGKTYNHFVYNDEKPLTSYLGKDSSYATFYSEWFAEMFRLFVTNPDLLSIIRPETYKRMKRYFWRVETRPWQEVLANAPERTFAQAQKLCGVSR